MDNPRLVEDKAGGDWPGPRICVTLLPNQLLSDPGVGAGRGGAGQDYQLRWGLDLIQSGQSLASRAHPDGLGYPGRRSSVG